MKGEERMEIKSKVEEEIKRGWKRIRKKRNKEEMKRRWKEKNKNMKNR